MTTKINLPVGFEDYSRAACYALTSCGLTVDFSRESVSYIGLVYPFSPEERYRAWLWDSLLTGCRAFERGDVVLALRCLLQVASYEGKLGGFPGPSAGDGYNALKAAIERRIGGQQ